MSKISTKNLICKYKGKKRQYVTVLENVDEVFLHGETSVILGASGCGKTTLLRAIAGILPFEGAIYFDEVNVSEMSPKDRNVSYVSQMIGLYPTKSVFNNIAFPLKIIHCSGEEIRERVMEVAKMLHIEACITRKPKELSIGQAQRVAIARALVKRSNVYLFDEPFSNLDKPLSHELTIEIKKIFKNTSATVIFVSHDVNEALALADTIYVMDNGKFIFKGSPRDFLHSHDERLKGLKQDL